MTSGISLRSDSPSALARGARLFLRYFMGLVVIPQLVLVAGVWTAWHAEWVYSLVTLPLILYCAPVVGVFGSSHFIAHATLCPADLVGWARVVAFYSVAAVLMATVHTLVRQRRSRAEPCAPPNGGPAEPFRDSGVGGGPPSVS
jgi:hypothetical protein